MVGCIVLALGPTKVATATATPTSSTTSTTVPTITGWTATPLGTVTSAAEHAGKIYIGRDGGYSVRLDALGSLWLFGDTLVRGAPPSSKILFSKSLDKA
jgi:hypothetical protein